MGKIIDENYLLTHPNHIFVFGDNLLRIGYGGAAKLRDYENTYGFITKKFANNNYNSFYRSDEYVYIFDCEVNKLIKTIQENPDKIFLISKLGAGLANKYHIWENIIEPNIKHLLSKFENVEFLW